MDNPMELRVEQHEDTPEIAEHPKHCICTGCATERQLERGGRYDNSIASHLHHIKDLRELRAPRSTGDAGYRATEATQATPPPTPEKADTTKGNTA